jgi:hypothetical protein
MPVAADAFLYQVKKGVPTWADIKVNQKCQAIAIQ